MFLLKGIGCVGLEIR